jgi:hypothetical protein
MYRSPLLNERRRGLPGGGNAGAAYYSGAGGSRPPRGARFASAVLLAAITLGALAAQKVLVCDVAAAEAAQREAALVDSLKRLQGSLASRNAQSGASLTAYQARTLRHAHRASKRDAIRHAAVNADMRLAVLCLARCQGAKGASLSAPEKVRYDRRIQEKEIAAQRAKKDAAAARAEADECTAQLQALSAGAGDGAGADSAAAAAAAAAMTAGRAEAKKLRAQLQKADTRAAAAASRERALQARRHSYAFVTGFFRTDALRVARAQEALDGARAEAVALRAQIAAQAAAQAVAPAEGGWAGSLEADGSTEEGAREGDDAAEGGAARGENEAPGEVAGADADAVPDAPAPAAGGEDTPAHGRKAKPRAPKLKRQNARRWPPGGGDAEDEAVREAAGLGEADGARDRATEASTETSEESTASSDAPLERSEDRFAV